MSDEVFADAQVNDSVQSNAQVGELYNYENSIIVSEVTRADLEAGLATKVNKAGDSMTGDLELEEGLAVKLDGETDYVVKSRDDAHQLVLFDSTGKGIFLDGTDNERPYYNNGTNSYRILNTDDITNGTTDYLRTWGNMIGTISDQTDLTQYIKDVIGGADVLGRPNYSAAIDVTLLSYQGTTLGYVSQSYTIPSTGYFVPYNGQASNNFYINGILIQVTTEETILLPVSAGDIASGVHAGSGSVALAAMKGYFFPQRNL